MDGVVSLLDEPATRIVEDLWAELTQRFNLRGVYATPYPHFSYHIAPRYDRAALEPVLRRIAQGARPFEVRTTGLGVFTGPNPVLYVPVVRDPALTEFHRRVWQAVDPAGSDAVAYYTPANWMPHITLGFGDLQPASLAAVINALGGRSLTWEIAVDNLGFIWEHDGRQEVQRFPFGRAAG